MFAARRAIDDPARRPKPFHRLLDAFCKEVEKNPEGALRDFPPDLRPLVHYLVERASIKPPLEPTEQGWDGPLVHHLRALRLRRDARDAATEVVATLKGTKQPEGALRSYKRWCGWFVGRRRPK